MEFKKLKIDSLVPAAYNPRKKLKPGDAEFEKIKNSIAEFGFVDPIIVNTDMTIIGGHQRWSVLKELGHTEVDCVIVEVDKTKEKALNIALNKITGAWNNDKLAAAIRDLQELDYDVGITGFDPPEIDELFNSVHSKETKEDDCDIPLPAEPVTQTGDVWQLGRHRLICGDSSDKAAITALMENKKANLVLTDPPTAAAYPLILDTLKNAAANMAADASVYIFHTDAAGLDIRRAFTEAGLYISGVCVWIKPAGGLRPGGQDGSSPYKRSHRPVLFGWHKKGRHNWYTDRKQSTLWTFEREPKSTLHPDMLPIALCAYPMLNSTMTGGIVLDPFGGTGSVLIAAEQTGRVCYTAEVDPRYCDVMVKRYAAQTGSGKGVFLIRGNEKKSLTEVGFDGV